MADVDSILKSAVSGVASALFGFISAVAVFRSRFAVIENQRTADLREIEQKRASDLRAIESDRQHDKELLKIAFDHLNSTIGRIERRQIAALELTANIAHKAGISSRAVGADVLVELLQHGDDVK